MSRPRTIPAAWRRGPHKSYDPQREKFAQLVASGTNASRAYAQAGFSGKNDDIKRANASRMKRQMADRIAEILGVLPVPAEPTKISEMVQKTIEAFQKDLPWCRDKLHEMINDKETPAGVRLSAVKECLNRGMGLPVQYVEQNLNVRYQISDRELTEEEWFARYAKPVELLPEPTEPTEH